VITGQMTRNQAIEIIAESPYVDASQEREDYQFVLKKLGFTEEYFAAYLQEPSRPHSDYPSEKLIWDFLFYFYKKIRVVFRR
jgi:hypothetical protein